jgi:dTDP-4-dehydrorhamnose reductase
MQRVLITGHTGMLGQSIVQKFHALKNVELFGVSKTRQLKSGIREFNIDLTNETEVASLLGEIRPKVIIHTAAFTNLQHCETFRADALQFHVHLTRQLASIKCPMIYISTDSVFQGEEGNYSEDSPTYPLNYYAHSKLEGEWAARCSNPYALVLRLNIYGFKKPPGSSLAEWGLKSFQEGRQISGFNDVFFNPLYVGQAAELIRIVHNEFKPGILHIGTVENISKFAFLKKLANTFGFSDAFLGEVSSSADVGLRRPKNTTLNIQKLKTDYNQAPSLAEGLAMFKSDYLHAHENN